MKTLIRDQDSYSAMVDYLDQEFGSHTFCQFCGSCAIPPKGVPFKVLEPLQTGSMGMSNGHGLDKHMCIPVGIYRGIGSDIHAGSTVHSFRIDGSPKHETHDVFPDAYQDSIDWRGVRKVKPSKTKRRT